MNSPLNNDDSQLLLNALVDLKEGMEELKGAVERESAAREHKTEAIKSQTGVLERQNKGLIVGVLILILIAGLNFFNTSRTVAIADDARETNELLLGCFQPGTPCADLNRQQTADVMNQIRQTQFTIAVCQRSNPIPTDPSPREVRESTDKVIECVQSYYPGFELPERVEN